MEKLTQERPTKEWTTFQAKLMKCWKSLRNERITKMERKILDMDEKHENRSEDNKKEHVGENQGKTVITGFHSETTDRNYTTLERND